MSKPPRIRVPNLPEALSASYDRVAENYNEMIVKSKYGGPTWFFETCQSIAKPEIRVLDLACACGNVGQEIHRRNPSANLIGLDIAPKMIDQARKTNAYAKLLVHDLNMPIAAVPAQTIDLALALGCLEFVNDLEMTLKEIRRTLVAGGEFYLTLQCHNPEDLNKPAVTSSGPFQHYAYTANEARDLFSKTGFDVKTLKENTGYVASTGFATPYLFIEAVAL